MNDFYKEFEQAWGIYITSGKIADPAMAVVIYAALLELANDIEKKYHIDKQTLEFIEIYLSLGSEGREKIGDFIDYLIWKEQKNGKRNKS